MHGLTWCVIYTVCEQPTLVCHGPQLPCMRTLTLDIPWASFTLTLHSRSNPSPTWQRARHIACTKLPEDVQSSWMHSFKIYGIWPQTDRHNYIHTHNFRKCSHASVEHNWGSFRLTPIMQIYFTKKDCIKHCILYKLYWREGLSKNKIPQ